MPAPSKGWSRPFGDPIPLPDGSQLVTLRDAGDYVLRLRKRKRELPHWQTATEILIQIGNHGGDPMLARIAVLQAINHDKPPPAPRAVPKSGKTYRIIR